MDRLLRGRTGCPAAPHPGDRTRQRAVEAERRLTGDIHVGVTVVEHDEREVVACPERSDETPSDEPLAIGQDRHGIDRDAQDLAAFERTDLDVALNPLDARTRVRVEHADLHCGNAAFLNLIDEDAADRGRFVEGWQVEIENMPEPHPESSPRLTRSLRATFHEQHGPVAAGLRLRRYAHLVFDDSRVACSESELSGRVVDPGGGAVRQGPRRIEDEAAVGFERPVLGIDANVKAEALRIRHA